MTLYSILLVGIALSFDAMAVGAANGAHHHEMKLWQACRIALFFGFFQFFMPFAGWLVGSGVASIVSRVGPWIAFFLLVILGVKMILESLKPVEEREIDIYDLKILLLLSVATSVDALVVGMTFALLPVKIWMSVIIIGLATFLLSLLSIYAGKKFGERWGKKAEILGGVVLITVGFKILLTSLFG